MFYMFVLFWLCWWTLIKVFVALTDEIQSVSVIEGNSVLLPMDVTEIQDDDNILWKFGAGRILIAKINRHKRMFSTFDGPDGRFRDRLKVDQQTGSLIITNITTQHAGDYQLQIIGAKWSSKTFSVSVYGNLPTPNITRDYSQNLSSSSSQQNCSLLCSVVNVGHVTLSWYKGKSLLSSISVSDLSISLSLPLEVEYQDKNSYSCVINNPIRNQTTHLNITQLCHTHPVSLTALISAAGFLLIVAAVVMCCIRKKCRKTVTAFKTLEEDRTDSSKSQKPKSKADAVYQNVPKKQ
ncbi:CD48 antigen-like isoform X2 [Carassius carassius]|uniref:CD48 antigen-like isoform X2 n=1 Tax=Carassius carassius TaxID=217509 RepID=UPI00286880BD|nr:CD48 antigen-like isoform X2 [Carassius carassius]